MTWCTLENQECTSKVFLFSGSEQAHLHEASNLLYVQLAGQDPKGQLVEVYLVQGGRL